VRAGVVCGGANAAEWDTNEALTLPPAEVEARIRSWRLDDHLKVRHCHVGCRSLAFVCRLMPDI
jgi:hypothetical protein